MSKYKIAFLFLFSIFQLFSQSNSLKKVEHVTKSSSNFDSKTIDSTSFSIEDSLKIVLRKKLISELAGNWKMIDDTPSWVMREDSIVGHMITIKTEEIQFLDLIRNAKSWKKVNTEKIVYIDQLANESSYSELVFANNQIWAFYIDEKTGYLKLTYTGDRYSNTGRTEFVCSLLTKTYFKLL